MDTTHAEVAFLDGLRLALHRIDGSGPYTHAVGSVVEGESILDLGEPPIAVMGTPSVRLSRGTAALTREGYVLTVPVALAVPAGGETQAARVLAAMTAWHDLRRAITHRVDGSWLGVLVPTCAQDMRLTDVVVQPETDGAASWYGVARCTVEIDYSVPYPATEV